MKIVHRFALLMAFAAFCLPVLSSCGGKKYLPPPEERPGELQQVDPAVRETDERVPYSVDVPVP
jgi:predicted  nucleic acid-binding Zn-ribbon protein